MVSRRVLENPKRRWRSYGHSQLASSGLLQEPPAMRALQRLRTQKSSDGRSLRGPRLRNVATRSSPLLLSVVGSCVMIAKSASSGQPQKTRSGASGPGDVTGGFITRHRTLDLASKDDVKRRVNGSGICRRRKKANTGSPKRNAAPGRLEPGRH